MDNFEEEVQYFVNLVFDNIQKAKKRKGGKIQTVFNGLNISKDGQGVLVYDFDKEYVYEFWKKDIENFEFKQYLTKHLALYYIDKLYQYDKKEISFKELAGIRVDTTPKVVKDILKPKHNISEQIKALRSNRDIKEVQEFIDSITNDERSSK